MKKFCFRLESLMKYRQYQELQAQQAVAGAYRDVRACEMRIHTLEQAHLRTVQTLDRAAAKGMTANEFKNYSDYLDGLADDLGQQFRQKKTLEAQLREKQALLTRRSVDRQVLERLKVRKRNEYIQEFMRAEQNASDEIASLKKAREITHGTH